MTNKRKNQVTGAAGGILSGLFGGGGGMAVLPLLVKWRRLEGKKSFATCVGIIFPMCCISAAVYWWHVRPEFTLIWPYIAGGVLGGTIGGLTFEKVPVRVLKVIFGLFLIYGGVRYLLW